MNEQVIKLIETVIMQGGDAAVKIIIFIYAVNFLKVIVPVLLLPWILFRGVRQIVVEVKKDVP